MPPAPAISLIMPVYNSMPYLIESLDAILAQTFKDIEIILVDDGSTDSSLSTLHSYAGKDERITVIRSTHAGAGAARNKGLAQARGEYLAFVDSDDLFSPHMLEKAYFHAKKHNSDIVLFNYGIQTENTQIEYRCGLLDGPVSPDKNLASGLSCIDITGPEVWNKIFRRESIIRNGIKFQNLRTCNDIAFVRNAFIMADSIHFLDEGLMTWRRTSSSISNNRYLHAENILEAGKYMRLFIKQNFPHDNLGIFYSMMFRHIMYEYSQFPRLSESRPFVAKANKFLPIRYQWKFFKKRLRKTIKHFIRMCSK